MVQKSLALFSLALVIIAGILLVSACASPTPTVAPTATPSPAASATPTAAPTAAPSNVTTAAYNQSYNNKTVTVKSGQNFTIALEENPSTGYAWNATVTSGLAIINSTYRPGNTSLVGAPGLHEWLIMAKGTGNQSFSAIYKRAWEPVFGNETAFKLNVTVTA